MGVEFEHEDLEEKFKISARVEFQAEGATFEGMNQMEMGIPMKKKNIEKNITNVELRPAKGGLF